MSNFYDRIIIDGNNLLYRAFYVKRPIKNVNGLNVSTIEQFLYMIKSACIKYKPKEIYITWDKKLNPAKKNFRKDLIAYKEQRQENDKTIELLSNIEHIQKFIDYLGIKTIYPYSTEADDVIRFLCKKYKNNLIISNDKDLLQLIDKDTNIYLANKDCIVTPENFEENAGINIESYILYKSIMGDVSDNINGLSKYGPVRAKILAKKINQNNSLDFSKSDLDETQIETIKRNLKIIDLSYVEKFFPEEYDNYETQDSEINVSFCSEKLKELFKQYNFSKFLNNFSEWNMIFNTNKDVNDLLCNICL